MTTKTLFEKIRDREIPATIVYEDDEFIAFKDIKPAAKVHVLIVPKKPYPTLEAVEMNDQMQLRLLQLARRLAKELGVSDNYKLHLNVGDKVQAVPHLHLHLLGGFDKETPTAL
ncbi:MAG: HIT domain-containing protein [bacterium]|nr:HIT domain-containing protein [bacterium]